MNLFYSYHDKLAFYPDSFTDSEFYGVLAALIVTTGYSVVITIIVAGGMIIIVKKEKQKPVVSESRALQSSYCMAGMFLSRIIILRL